MLAGLMLWASAQDLPNSQTSERNTEVAQRIRAMAVDLNFEDATLDEVISYLREFSGLNMIMVPEVMEQKDSLKVTLKVKGVRLQSVLKLILGQHNLGAVVRDGILEITTREKLNLNTVLRVYDVRDLFVKINNFPGPRLELLPGAGAGGGPGVTFTLEEPEAPKVDQGFLEELIRNTCDPQSWEENSNASIQISANGLLMIQQTKAVHREIEVLVNMIREIK
jgi:hypothetical protein